MARKSETNFRNNTVVPFLKTLANTAFFSIQQMAIHGDPDIFLCINSRFVGMEIKDDDEEPRPLQEHKLQKIRNAGGIAFHVDRNTWPQAKLLLTALSQGENI